MTNQEKMQYIYERTGIEPKYSKHIKGDLIPWKKCNGRTNCFIDGTPKYSEYYPAEQLWDLLPHVIGNYCLIESKDLPGIVSTGYYKQEGNTFCSSDNLEIKMGESSLDTRLDMVLWCISQGYIKGKDDE